MSVLEIKKLYTDSVLPYYATDRSAGMDLSALLVEAITIPPGQSMIIATGIAIALPNEFEAQIRPRSGLAAKHSITVLNAPGTIDADYRGEIKVILMNHGTKDFVITNGMRIAQMVIARYKHMTIQEVKSLDLTKRGENGFGSTGH